MPTLRRAYADGPFGQVHARVARPDTARFRPLVCLHQSPKSGLEMEAVMRACAHDRVVLAPDYPGYGMSDPPPSEADASIQVYARAMWAAVDHWCGGPVDLFGNHTGAMVAAEMARVRPHDVGAIMMVSSPILTQEERAAFAAYFTPIPLDKAGTRFTTMWSRIRDHAGPGVALEWMARSFMQNLLGGEQYEWGHAAAFAYAEHLPDVLAALAHRIVVINPADELQDATRRAGPIFRNGAIVEKPDWGHGFLDVHAEAVAAMLREIASPLL